jgi:hypothetical protein
MEHRDDLSDLHSLRRAYDDLLRSFQARLEDLTFAQQQVTAMQVDAALRDSYIVDLQRRLDDAKGRIADLERQRG